MIQSRWYLIKVFFPPQPPNLVSVILNDHVVIVGRSSPLNTHCRTTQHVPRQNVKTSQEDQYARWNRQGWINKKLQVKTPQACNEYFGIFLVRKRTGTAFEWWSPQAFLVYFPGWWSHFTLCRQEELTKNMLNPPQCLDQWQNGLSFNGKRIIFHNLQRHFLLWILLVSNCLTNSAGMIKYEHMLILTDCSLERGWNTAFDQTAPLQRCNQFVLFSLVS